MELEEMQATWAQMSSELQKQQKLTDRLILQMTQERYKNKIGILSKYEGMGAVICYIAAILLLFHLDTMDTWYLTTSALLTLAYLVVLPSIVLHSIYNLKNINVVKTTYSKLLVLYTKRKKRFLRLQRIGIFLNFIFVGLSLPVALKVFKGKDLFVDQTHILYWYIPGMLLFLIFFSRWGYKKYKNVMASANAVLEDLEAAH